MKKSTVTTKCPNCQYTRRITIHPDGTVKAFYGTQDFETIVTLGTNILVCPKCGVCCSQNICQTVNIVDID